MEPASPNSFGLRLRKARHARGLTLGELAVRAGTAKGYLSLLENGQRPPPQDEKLIQKMERILGAPDGWLLVPAHWERTPAIVRREFSQIQSEEFRRESVVRELKALLQDRAERQTVKMGELRGLVDRLDPEGARAKGNGMVRVPLNVEVPLINSVSAGYPTEFTDLGYPARVADEYVRCPDLSDPDAFAARVVGDSMLPVYMEGDVVVFSPAKAVKDGCDCFVRLERSEESTFKRVFLEKSVDGDEVIRLQPLNREYPVRVLPREQVAGMYAAVSVIRRIG